MSAIIYTRAPRYLLQTTNNKASKLLVSNLGHLAQNRRDAETLTIGGVNLVTGARAERAPNAGKGRTTSRNAAGAKRDLRAERGAETKEGR